MAKIIIEIKNDGAVFFKLDSPDGKIEGSKPSLKEVLISIKNETSHVTVEQSKTIERMF